MLATLAMSCDAENARPWAVAARNLERQLNGEAQS